MRSIIGDVMAEVTSPTKMSSAPAIPAWVSEKEYGASIWLIRDERLLNKDTYIQNGIIIK